MKLKLFKTDAKFNIIGFHTAFNFSHDEKWSFSGEAHNFWEVVFISEGKVIATEDEKIYLLKKNNLLFHAPMEFHRIKSATGSSPKGFIMSFSLTGKLPESLKKGVFELSTQEADEYINISKKVISIVHQENNPEFLATETCALLSAFFIKIGTADRAKRIISGTQSAQEYKKAVEIMALSVCENLSLDEIAKKCNISTSYLKLLFKSYAGVPPKVYYNNLRLKQSQEFLDAGLSSKEISYKMGFSSPNYFTVFFKSATGLTPLQYRKQK